MTPGGGSSPFFGRTSERANETKWLLRPVRVRSRAPDRSGQTHGRTDTYRGRFVRLVPNELVVELDEFETDDPSLRGEMTSTIRLSDADGVTEVIAVHDGLPEGLSPADNEIGWREALARLAALVESPR